MAGIILNRSRQVPAEETPAFGGIAERFRRAGDLDRAIALCRDGLKRFPDQLSARVTLGWSLLDKGQYEEARAELERVLRRAPDNLAAIRGLAELHDRSEGAMPSMDERESWRQDAADESRPAAHAHAAEAAVAALSVAPTDDPFAPIAVTLASATAGPSPEIVHTAEGAQMAAEEAAVAAETEMLLGTGEPIAFETAADAAVAAAHAASEPFDASDPIQPIEGFDVDPLAAAAASLDIDVEGFDAGPVALDVDPVDHASVPAAALTAETDETADLLASLRSFGGGDDFVLDAPGEADVTLDLEALAADETASEPTASVPSMSLFEDEPVFLAEPVATEPVEAVDHAAHADVDASPAALVELAPALADVEAAHDHDHAEIAAATAPLADVEPVEPEPAFVPDLSFALGMSAAEDPADLSMGIPATVDADARVGAIASESEAASEPEFVPDLSAVSIGDEGAEWQAPMLAEPAPAAVVPPLSDAVAAIAAPLAPADRDADFVPDLDYALEMDPEAPASAEASPLAPLVDVAAEPRELAEVIPIDARAAAAMAKSPLPGLERFLRQVEARRLQLSSGSVA